jgi:predicted outer membrane repeat protein
MPERLIALASSALLIGGLFVGAPARARAVTDTVYVADVASAGVGGSCSAPDYATADSNDDVAIQAAIDEVDAEAGLTTVYLCAGTYNITATLAASENLILQGSGASNTVLDGGASVASDGTWVSGGVRILTTGSDLTIRKLTLQHAAARGGGDDGYGGAILNTGGELTVIDSVFRANNAIYGGGAIRQYPRVAERQVVIANSTFANNHAESEEGGAASLSNDAVISGSTFSYNTSGDGYDGGAVAVYGGDIEVLHSRFIGNISGYNGGAIYADNVIAVSTTFVQNAAHNNYGGAIYADSSSVLASSFLRNAAVWGGAIYATTGTISRNRFSRNIAEEKGGAVFLYDPEVDNLDQFRRNRFLGNTSASGGAVTFGPLCAVRTRRELISIERANRFRGNRATEQRRTNNLESLLDCVG